MYEAFFKLRRKPFDLVPDPAFIYLSSAHKKALTYLDYGIRERVGFILLTGEVGSGKTTLIRNLVQKKYDRVVLAKVFNTKVNSQQLLSMINDDFGLPVQGKDKTTLMRELNDFLVEQYALGNRPILIIDEAQNLDADLLEEVRMLSNLESSDTKLLQIILVGQPELRDTLAAPGLMQLRQRISINCHLKALSRAEMEQYIAHRMKVAGNPGAVTLSPQSLDVVHGFSRGIPRLVNILCDYIMLAAFADETTTVTDAMVQEIIVELDFEKQYWGEGEGNADAAQPVGVIPAPSAPAADPLPAVLQAVTETVQSLKGELLSRVNRQEAQVTDLHRKVETLSLLVESLAAVKPVPTRSAAPGFARRFMDGISAYGGKK